MVFEIRPEDVKSRFEMVVELREDSRQGWSMCHGSLMVKGDWKGAVAGMLAENERWSVCVLTLEVK